MKDIVKELQRKSFDQVIIRARQYYDAEGNWEKGESLESGVFITRSGTTYAVYTEFQAIACHSLTYRNRREGGFIWLSYLDPTPRYYPYTANPLSFRSVIWTGKDLIKEAWKAVYNSWEGIPYWPSDKPVTLCRQTYPCDSYSSVETDDLAFLRLIDRMVLRTRQHKNYHKRRLDDIARETPVNKRVEWYGKMLDNHADRNSLLETIWYRLSTFIDGRYDDLSLKLGVPILKKVELPSK